MLTITITPASIVFEGLTDEVFEVLQTKYGLPLTLGKYGDYIYCDTTSNMYMLLYQLSCEFEIVLK